jgi:hypothetical protein
MEDSHTCFSKRPQHEAEQSTLTLYFPFLVEIVERLLHRLAEPLPEPLWIKAEEFLVEVVN